MYFVVQILPFLPLELKEIKKCLLGFPDGAVQIIQRPSKNSEHSCYFERKKWSLRRCSIGVNACMIKV